MKEIEWTTSLSLGIKSLDEQHQELLRIANLLLFAIEKDQSEDAIVELLTRLREYTVFHFTAEEEFMAEIGYPGRGEHTQRHADLKQKVKNFQQSRFHREEVTLLEIRHLLSDWLLNHILDYDLRIAKFLNEKNK